MANRWAGRRGTGSLLLAVWLLAAPATAGADEGAEIPYVPSSASVVDTMLSMAGVGPGDYVIDLGSGDGRIPITAAKRYEARGLGIEYDAKLIAESRASAAREGVADRAEFRQQDIFEAGFSQATVVTMRIAGHWRGTLRGPQGEEPVFLEVDQQFQKARVTIWRSRGSISGSGRIQGDTLSLVTTGSSTPLSPLRFTLRVAQGRIQGEAAEGGRTYLLRASRILD